MAQFRYIEYKEDVNSLNVTALQQINKSGVYKGFDISVATLAINFVHTATGRSVLLPNGTKQANSGIILSKQGVIIIDDTTYSKTILANNDVSLGRWDIIVMTHQHVEVTGGAIATVDVIQGTLGAGKPDSSLTDYQIPLCYVYLPPSTTDLTTDVGVLVQPVRIEKDIIVAAKDSSPYYLSRADYICEGVADEVKIQSAIDYVTSNLTDGQAVSGKVLLASGSYYIENAITLKDGLHLEGVGEAAIYPDESASAITMLNITGDNVYLNNIKVGVYTSGNSATNSVNISAVSKLKIERCLMDKPITLTGVCSNIVIADNTIYSISGSDNVDNFVISNNTVLLGLVGGIVLNGAGSSNIRILGNYISGRVEVAGDSHIVSNNTVIAYLQDAITVTNSYNTLVGTNIFGGNVIKTINPLVATNGNIYYIPDASETQKGKVELATDAETLTGTATDKVLTPANLRSVVTIDDTWTEPALSTNWTNIGTGFNLAYKKDNLGNVVIVGRIEAAASIPASQTTIFTLPVGYQVSSRLNGIGCVTDAGISARVYYDNSPKGEIQISPMSVISTGDKVDINLLISKD